jgi:hypothetical protein
MLKLSMTMSAWQHKARKKNCSVCQIIILLVCRKQTVKCLAETNSPYPILVMTFNAAFSDQWAYCQHMAKSSF